MKRSFTLQKQTKSQRKPIWQALLPFILPKIGDSVWIGIFLFVSQMGQKMMNADGDLGRHLTIGSFILTSGQVPTSDVFSHTMAGHILTPHEWLSQTIFALFYRWWGFPGITLVNGIVIATTFWLVYKTARANSGSLSAALLTTVLAVFASLLHWLSRPHLFTFLLMALWMHELEALRANYNSKKISDTRWWTFPLMMVLWANLHGAFIAGFVTFALYGAGFFLDTLLNRSDPDGQTSPGKSFWSAYAAAGVVSLLVTILNPSGIKLWETSVGYLGSNFLVDMTVEYRSPNFHDLSAQPFLLLIGMTALLFGMQRRKIIGTHVIVTTAWMVMALYSARNIPLFAILSAPILASLIGDWFKIAAQRGKGLHGLWKLDQGLLKLEHSLRGIFYPLLALLWAFYLLSSGLNTPARSAITYNSDRFPVAAVDWLVEHPQSGNMFNEFTWGGYLLYRLWPEQLVFIDGQTDFYGEALTREYLQVKDVDAGWENVLDKYQVGWVIIPSSAHLASELRELPGWEPIYEDSTAQIFRRE